MQGGSSEVGLFEDLFSSSNVGDSVETSVVGTAASLLRSESHLVPSLFELVCRERLDGGLQASFHDVSEALLKRSQHSGLKWMRYYSDELFLLFHGCLQFKFLFQYESSFADNFYALKRVRCVSESSTTTNRSFIWKSIITKPWLFLSSSLSFSSDDSSYLYRRLNNSERLSTLLVLVVGPYLEFKLERRYRRLLDMNDYERRLYFESSSRLIQPINESEFDNDDNDNDNDDRERSDHTFSLFFRQCYLRYQRWLQYASVKLDEWLWQWYPAFDSTIHGISLMMKLLYLFNLIQYDSFINAMWLRQCTQRIDMKDLQHWKLSKEKFDHVRMNQTPPQSSSMQQSSLVPWSQRLRMIVMRTLYMCGDLSRMVTLCVIFGFKWIQWLINSEDQLMLSSNDRRAMPVPAAPVSAGNVCHLKRPMVSDSADSNSSFLRDSNDLEYSAKDLIHRSKRDGLCLICEQPRTNPACLNTGYVFCYRCVFQFVKEHGCCPVTRAPVTTMHIRRIYED